jgi:hypothetical protein
MKPADIAIAVACSAFASGAFAAPSANRMAVYDATQLAHDSYVVVERIGIDTWKSAFGIGGYRDEPNARNAVLARAERLGADGVINLHCLGQTDRLFNPAGYYCYGNAIRVRRNEPRVSGSDEKR